MSDTPRTDGVIETAYGDGKDELLCRMTELARLFERELAAKDVHLEREIEMANEFGRRANRLAEELRIGQIAFDDMKADYERRLGNIIPDAPAGWHHELVKDAAPQAAETQLKGASVNLPELRDRLDSSGPLVAEGRAETPKIGLIADQADVSRPAVAAPVTHLINGRPYRPCNCPKFDGKCQYGLERVLLTTQLSRCLVAAGIDLEAEAKDYHADQIGIAKCSVCGADRLKAPCPRGPVAAAMGLCPMAGEAKGST